MKIAYFTAGDRNWASSRLRAWKVADALTSQGHDVTMNGYPWAADVVVMQKRFDMNDTMQQLRQRGIRVVWDCDDYIPNGPAQLADVITVDTHAKQKLYPGSVVIPDVLDLDDNSPCKTEHADKLERVVWFGNPDNWYHTLNVAEACRRLGLELVMITDLTSHHIGQLHDVTGVQWTASSVDHDVIAADVVACSYVIDDRHKDWITSKSANRLVKAWGLGMPVIGSPIPSYVAAGLTYQADTIAEWTTALMALRDKQARQDDAKRGYAIAQEYCADKVARRWLEVFSE
jgi:hypothetical protein